MTDPQHDPPHRTPADRTPANSAEEPPRFPRGPENLDAYRHELDALRERAHEADPVQDPTDADPGQHLRAPEEMGIRQARPQPDPGMLAPEPSDGLHGSSDGMPVQGATIHDVDGGTLGKVERVLGDYLLLRIDGAPRWYPRSELTPSGTAMNFKQRDAIARSVPAPDHYEASQYIDPALRTEDEERQRERMLQELASQRRDLHDGDALPDAGRTIGEPVEEELGIDEERAPASPGPDASSAVAPRAAPAPGPRPRDHHESR